MAVLDGLLDAVVANHQESLLLTPGLRPRYQTDGRLTDAAAFEMDAGIIAELLEEAAPNHEMPEPNVGTRWKFDYPHNSIEFEFSAAFTPEGWSVSASPVGRRSSNHLCRPRTVLARTGRRARSDPSVR